MKTSAGILSYEIYNQEGKNELSISQQENYTQSLKLKLQNTSPYHKVLFDVAKTPHLTLKFKKGVLPKGFKSDHIKVNKYRLIKGSDLFSKAALEGYLFDKAKMEQDENFQVDVQKILDSIDASQATRSIAPMGIPFGIEGLLTHFNSLKPAEKTTKYKWIGQLEQIQTEYKAALASIRKLTLSNDVIKANPLFTSIIQETATVFEKLTALQQNSVDIEHSLDLLAKQVHEQQKADIQSLEANFKKNYTNATEHLVKALKTNLKTIIVEALSTTKISDITNLKELTLDENILKKLDNKVFIKGAVENSDWTTNITESAEEDSITFTCKKNIQLIPNEYLLMDFELIGALKGTAHSVATELDYSKLVFQKNGVEDTSVKNKISQSILNLVNDGAFGIPPALELLVAEGKEILNNGQYSNTVKLNLINKGLDNIILSDASKISLSFYNQQENETVAYALQGKDDALESIKIAIPSLNIKGFLTKNTALIKDKLDITLNNIKRLKLPFQDFSAIFYTNYSVSTKQNGNKTKLYTGVIAIKATSNSIAIYQPLPNPQNPEIRDLETKEVSASAFSSLNEAGFQLVDEPMEITGTFDLDNSQLAIAQKAPISVSLVGLANRVTSFDLAKSTNSSTIQTTYQSQNALNTTIPPNHSLQLILNGIKTQLPVGVANLKVSLLNIPNYKDAHLSSTVNRVAYLNSSSKGIFTTGDTNNNLQLIQDKIEVKTNMFNIDANVYNVLPAGSIMMWYGAVDNIPGGWKLCDGDNGTPDLRNRFVVGAGDNYKKDDKGGEIKVVLNEDEMPSHKHDITIDEKDLEKPWPNYSLTGGELQLMAKDTYIRKYEEGDKTGYDRDGVEDKWRLKHAIQLKHNHTGSASITGKNQAHENRPPFYAIYYIMRITLKRQKAEIQREEAIKRQAQIKLQKQIAQMKAAKKITTTDALTSNMSLKTLDKKYTFIVQPDGNMVIYSGSFEMVNGDYQGNAQWNSNTYQKPLKSLILKDGDLIAFDNNQNIVWTLSSFSNYTPNPKAKYVYWKNNALIVSDENSSTLYTIWSA